MKHFYQKMMGLMTVLLLSSAFLSNFSYAQTGIRVTGVVTDETNMPLTGVSITIPERTGGTLTDVNGNFSITVPDEQSVLQFTYTGFTTQERKVGSTRNFKIAMQADSRSLNEVVVVGYGTQKRKDITGAVVSVDRKRLENLPNTNISQALEGAVPGLTVTQTAGGAEGNSNTLLIRGKRSITASNNPLLILDGIPYNGSLTDLNPSDVENIEILKDASAAGIYGSRGANGVILVTTKKGRSGKPVISYNGSYGIEKMGMVPRVLSPTEFYNFKKERNPSTITLSEQEIYDSGNFPNYLQLATRTGSRNQQNISVSGGGNHSRFYVSADYLDVAGIAINDHFRRVSTKANIDVDITKWLSFGTTNTLTYDDRSGLSPTFTGDYSVITFNPLTSPYNPDGSLTIYPWPETVYYANPLAPTLASNSNHTYSIFNTSYAVIRFPVKGLSYRINTGIRYASAQNNTYYGRNTKTGLENQGSATTDASLDLDYTIENLLYYNRIFGKHKIDFTGLYSLENNRSTDNTLKSSGFPNDVLTWYQANVALKLVPSSDYSNRTLLSQMGRLNYSYNEKYMVTLTTRRDGSSAFGENRKYGFFPMASLGWNISSEPFMKEITFVTNLKLRVSCGKNGNQAVSPYNTLAGLTTRSYVNGVNPAPGYIPTKLADKTLHWETTKTFNTGLDFDLFRERITGSIDVYSARTYDLLLRRSVSTISGVSSIVQNIGKTANKGIDLGINSINIKTKAFSWSSNITFSLNRNKIVDLYGNGQNDTLNNWFIGHPIDNNFSYKYGGVWQLTDDVSQSPQPNTQPGYAKVVDINGDGKITGSDRTLLPGVQPAFTYGLGNTFEYHNWSLYVFVNGVQGVTKQNNTLYDAVNTAVEKNTFAKNYWTPTNPTNEYYANANIPENYNPNIYGVRIFQNASYLRVRDIILTCSLPAGFQKNIGTSRCKVYLEARNLFTITPWKGFDPELSSSTEGIPLQKEFVFGINVSL
ncbi:SusC/RagA family TonB-linked outer membrane protein [Niabella ginsenosidivorans]|uniref:SusC/RagA family TonB-linked outer membrane protein n=1 Tax=Niabella ginsenosidivorans TaxID=1176587 RepID=A0A1A9I1R0_9BACT|nr:TonB-dependent receptor [Niabella ginsenosidivorans]ANH81588.1 SusC/RagA family TonB-linked outer membrane protein [Niabella ginsenosidivorans]